MNKRNIWSRTKRFGGYIELTKSDLYRFHLRIGPLAAYLETPKLYAIVKEARRRKEVDR